MRTEIKTLLRKRYVPRGSAATFAGACMVFGLVVIAASIAIFSMETRRAAEQAQRTLDVISSRISESLATPEVGAVEKNASRILNDSRVLRVVVADASAKAVVDLQSKRETPPTVSMFASLLPQSSLSFDLERSLAKDGKTVGSLSVHYFVPELAESLGWVMLIALALVAVTIFLAWLTYRRLHDAVVIPANAIQQLSDEITRTGNLSVRLPQLGADGQGRFEESMNNLLSQLDSQEKKKSVYRALLAREIGKRTNALAATNEQLRQLAYTSSETSLPNKAAFLDRMHKLVAAAPTDSKSVGVFVVRMTRVRYANETFGFDVGDLMIDAAARNLSAILAPSSELFHLGGAEFAVFNTGEYKAMQTVATDLLRVDDVAFVYRGASLTLQPKIGYAVFPSDATNVDDLTRFAMLALNTATTANSASTVVHFDPILLEKADEVSQIEASIRRAVDGGLFEPFFQARVDTRTGQVNGLEAFVRWTSPELVNYTNYDLIPIAARSLLATEVDMRMMAKVVQWLAPLAVDGIRIPVAINVSAQTLQRSSLPQEIAALVRTHSVKPAQLEIELVEAVLVGINDRVTQNLRALSGMGIGLLLGNFGSGHASLRHLRELPISIVKIDRAFIAGLPDDAIALAIVESTIKLSRRLGKRVVAEGVETYAQWELLRAIGCDEVQGYFLMRPLPGAKVAEMLRLQFDTSVGHMTLNIASLNESVPFPGSHEAALDSNAKP